MLTFSIRLAVQLSVLLILLFSYATWDGYESLSPQGCRMSWMSPSYILQTRFDTTWTPLAKRYKLWLYREVGWDSVEDSELRKDSRPVLFIPGNAGSARQVRSIASSATRQFYESPNIISGSFSSRDDKPLDFYTVDFNEDLSAFHGTTIEAQIAYTAQAISYILSLYPAGTQIPILAHSMGGIVATSLLPSTNVSGIITMSTPFTLPPVRFDSRIDRLYDRLKHTLEDDTTPILSLCGGAKDLMISSESCILPKPSSENIFRKTVFTSALEGSWSGVGHQEMVWCHQIRWRVARAVLELGQSVTNLARGQVLDKWLRDGHSLPPIPLLDNEALRPADVSNAKILDAAVNLRLISPHGSTTTLLPTPSDETSKDSLQISVLLSQGSIGGVSPQNHIPLRASVFMCHGKRPSLAECPVLKPGALRLIPNPAPGSTFPNPGDGSDESEGVVLYEAPLPPAQKGEERWVGIRTTGGDGRGWVVAGLNRNKPSIVEASTWSLLFGKASVAIANTQDLSIPFSFPNLLSNAMVVYRVSPHRASATCTVALLPPLMVHTSHEAETHYFPWHRSQDRRILLHTHLEAPFIDSSTLGNSIVNFTIYSSREKNCREDLTGFDLTIDWKATLGRWGSRYLNPLISWAAGVTALVVFLGWNKDDGAAMPTVEQSLDNYSCLLFQYLLPCFFLLALIPLPVSLYTGNGGQVFLSPIAPILLLVASGLVGLVWRVVQLFLMICTLMSKALCGTRKAKASIQSGTFVSLMIICTATALLIPWQVVYVGCWLLHLYTCASTPQPPKTISESRSSIDIQLQSRNGNLSPTYLSGRNSPGMVLVKQNNLNHNLHLLLLMTWFLPLTAPVLAVWVRTLLTAGYTTPFDGDHNFFSVLPFLVLVDFASWTPGQLFERPSFEKRFPLKWLFVGVAAAAFTFGSRKPYLVLDVGRVALWVILACRIGRRYWGGPSWT